MEDRHTVAFRGHRSGPHPLSAAAQTQPCGRPGAELFAGWDRPWCVCSPNGGGKHRTSEHFQKTYRLSLPLASLSPHAICRGTGGGSSHLTGPPWGPDRPAAQALREPGMGRVLPTHAPGPRPPPRPCEQHLRAHSVVPGHIKGCQQVGKIR